MATARIAIAARCSSKGLRGRRSCAWWRCMQPSCAALMPQVLPRRVRAAMHAAKVEPETEGSGRAGSGKDYAGRLREWVQGKRKAEEPADVRQTGDAAVAVWPAVAEGGSAEATAAAPEAPAPPGGPDDEGDEEREEEGGGKRPRSLLKKKGRGAQSAAATVAPSRQLRVHDGELLTAWERRREEYKERKRLGGRRDRDTMSKLTSFLGKLKSAPPPPPLPAALDAEAPAKGPAGPGGVSGEGHAALAEGSTAQAAPGAAAAPSGYDGKVDERLDHRALLPAAWRFDAYLTDEAAAGGDSDSLEALRAHRLVFKGPQSGSSGSKDGMQRSEAVDDYVVVDPLLEAGKAKFNKQQQRQKKRGTEWAGHSRD